MSESQTSQLQDDDSPLWGVQAIAAAIDRPKIKRRHVYYMLEQGYLDATKIGRLWVTSRRRIRASLCKPYVKPDAQQLENA
jgi:hypothetical protein